MHVIRQEQEPAGALDSRILSRRLMDTDSYKVSHWQMLDDDTEVIYSHLCARVGAKYDRTLVVLAQYHLLLLEEEFINGRSFEYMKTRMAHHFLSDEMFNAEEFSYLMETYGGRLPVRIKMVPEGTLVPAGEVILTIENTDPRCGWLTNYLETRLSRMYYAMTVATVSHRVMELCYNALLDSGGSISSDLPFMLHGFGSRGVGAEITAAIGDAAHLATGFLGTDTLVAIPLIEEVYGDSHEGLCYSVPATEHSIMTQYGRTTALYAEDVAAGTVASANVDGVEYTDTGEYRVMKNLLATIPGHMILSVVIDSYDHNYFTTELASYFKEDILTRSGRTVFRPDSGDPVSTVLQVLENLYGVFGGVVNADGFQVLDTKVRVLWGDGIGPEGIADILEAMLEDGWAAENIVFGMGGHLLQKVDRDTQHFAFKCCARKAGGVWYGVYKDPVAGRNASNDGDADGSGYNKASFKGRLKLIQGKLGLETITEAHADYETATDVMETVFENGFVTRKCSFAEIRARVAEDFSDPGCYQE